MTFPYFDRPVPHGGYSWWYIDAVSDDGRHALTVIVFIGSVFSPYYYNARRFRRTAAALDHSAFNVALYGPNRRWAMTERDRNAVTPRPDSLAIGPSRVHWDGQALTLDVAERGSPLPRRVSGRIVVRPDALTPEPFALDAEARHLWHPLAPQGDVTVTLQNPGLQWSGRAYCDHNRGTRPLEADFNRWQWARMTTGKRRSRIDYDVVMCDGTTRGLALAVDAHGQVQGDAPQPAWHALPPTRLWRVPRAIRSEAAPSVTRTLEDTPFYARSEIVTEREGAPAHGVHESLSLSRFSAPWVRTLLRFRMPRVAGRSADR
ncbi:carotenoid 1,2-hydratase [Salinisphaera sp. Q1T1-3]|uniref:carotenoid 1,2-hydratase n=1 Tax=Salinisphaera sp. Q1T1-3 TaxID=2321229 RepID=UPI000E72AC90|nr:carotenoid 1,2-hydratase [Salinisphaera sp. Q1T1-3]RJS92102.1 carotenoid 1,2-hydratase [Salinisphaera sp. Q1T1-3]